MMIRSLRQAVMLFAASVVPGAFAATSEGLEREFAEQVRPLLATYCFGCHGAEKSKGGINLEEYETLGMMRRNPKFWENVVDQLGEEEMPPEDEKQPGGDERALLVKWLDEQAAHLDVASIPKDPGRVTIRRLNRMEYNNTMRDLFGIRFRPGKEFPADGAGGAGFDNNADTLFLPPILMEKYLEAAGDVLEAVFASDELRGRVLFVRPGGDVTKEQAARQILTGFSSDAFRADVAAEDVERFMGLFAMADARGDPFDDSIRLALKAVLVSPRFLFRREVDQQGAGAYRVSDFELASRLSYFLWASMPDRELLRLASEGRLHEPEVLGGQVGRMLLDSRSRALAEAFAGQWFGFDKVRELVQPDSERFPEFDFELRVAMYQEPLEYFNAIVTEDRSVLELLDSDTTFVNERLADHYGIPGVRGAEMRRVTLPGRERGGILGMGAILSATSYPLRTSPVLRGRFVLDEVLGTPPPPPPPNVPQLPKDDRQPDGLTFRQRLEVHRSRAECSSCHNRMDPIGFGLENFDAIGRFRAVDNGNPIDAAGELPGGEKFAGPAELRRVLMGEKAQFADNLVERMLGYALGRGLEYYDLPTVYSLRDKLVADGYRIQSLIHGITQSFPFQYRRNEPIER